MKTFSAFLAALALLVVGQSAHAQGGGNWSRTGVGSGTASFDTPCGPDAFTGADAGTEIVACNWSGFEIILLVMPEASWEIDGVTDRPFEQTREQLQADASTVYLNDTTISGASAFFAEGFASGGRVGTGMVDLNAGRLLVLLVQSDGSTQSDEGLSQVFARAWSSLEVAPQ